MASGTLLAFVGPDAGVLDAGMFVILPNGGLVEGGIFDRLNKEHSTADLRFECLICVRKSCYFERP